MCCAGVKLGRARLRWCFGLYSQIPADLRSAGIFDQKIILFEGNQSPRSAFYACAGGANINARAAILALGGVDDVDAVTFRDGAFRAFGFARAAHDAFAGNRGCHWWSSFLQKIQNVILAG